MRASLAFQGSEGREATSSRLDRHQHLARGVVAQGDGAVAEAEDQRAGLGAVLDQFAARVQVEAALGEVAEEGGVLVDDADDAGTAGRACSGERGMPSGSASEPSARGIGSPCGSTVGWPRKASIRSISRSEAACSMCSASSWTSSQGMFSVWTRNSSSSRCRRITFIASRWPGRRQARPFVGRVRGQVRPRRAS